MSSILTNRSAITALATLRNISMSLEETEGRVSTGLKVGKAEDNASYWAIANNLRNDGAILGTVSDSIGLGLAQLDTAYNGADQVVKVLNEIRKTLVLARVPDADKGKLNTDLDALKQRLISITQASSFNNDNWLYNGAGTKNIVSSFSRDATGAATVGTIPINAATTSLISTGQANAGLLTKAINTTQLQSATTTATTTVAYFLVNANSTTSASSTTAGVTTQEMKLTTTTADYQIDAMIRFVDGVFSTTQTIASTLGSITTGAKVQQEFVKTLQSAKEKGVSALVDADMNEESARLKALQTQQQLGLQALSIANSESEKLLILFR
jgi:flagellin